jgi:uncharacterized membrane protein YbhN (UPF0104 family)
MLNLSKHGHGVLQHSAVRSLGAIVSLGCLGFFLASAHRSWGSIRHLEWSTAMLSGGLLAMLFYLPTYALVTRSWQLVMCGLGNPVSFATAARILLVSQFAKYLPGNVGQHFGRILLARRAGLPVQTVLASMVAETLTLVLVACVGSLAAIHMLPQIIVRHGQRASIPFWIILAGLIAAVAAAISIPGVRRWMDSGLKQTAALLAPENRLIRLQMPLLHALNFVLGALCVRSLACALPGHGSPPFVPLLGVYSIAWLFGFLVPGAPAGLGVREAVLLLGLTPLSSRESALVIAAGLRIVSTLGDLLAVLTGLALRAGAKPPQRVTHAEALRAVYDGGCQTPDVPPTAAGDSGTMLSPRHSAGG